MCESGHTGPRREELRRALALLEAAIARHGQGSPFNGTAEAAHHALSHAVQMMRQEAEILRLALAR